MSARNCCFSLRFSNGLGSCIEALADAALNRLANVIGCFRAGLALGDASGKCGAGRHLNPVLVWLQVDAIPHYPAFYQRSKTPTSTSDPFIACASLNRAMPCRLHFRALSRKLQDGLNLFASNSELLNQFVDAHILKVLEYSRNRRAGPMKHHGAASLAGNAFNRVTTPAAPPPPPRPQPPPPPRPSR